jgi:hypothetical protein
MDMLVFITSAGDQGLKRFEVVAYPLLANTSNAKQLPMDKT